MRFLNLETKLKHAYRGAAWRLALLRAKASNDPSFRFFEQEVKPQLHRLKRLTVLPEHNVIFLPIEKNANSKTKRILAEIRGVRNPLARSEKKKFRTCLTAAEIPIQEFHRMLQAKDRLIFAVVRNPYERVFSAWANKFRGKPLVGSRPLQKPMPEMDTYLRRRASIDGSLPAGSDRQLSFDEFLTYVAAIKETWADPHVVPQARFLDIPFAPPEHFVRMESFSKDMLPLLERMKAPASVLARLDERVNPSGLGRNEYAITPEQRKKIEELYADDFERFGYRQ